MADSKSASKPAPKPAPKPLETVLTIIVIAALLGTLIERFREIFANVPAEAIQSSLYGYFINSFYPFIKFISFILSVLALWGIAWSLVHLTKLNNAQNAIFAPKIIPNGKATEPQRNRRWEKVLEHINSQNSNDWKFAILEADIILDELLDVMGYRGETLSDKLKRVESSDFETLELAWEAHKVRNSIAHEGADFLITEREARRVVGLYQKVFEEFHYI